MVFYALLTAQRSSERCVARAAGRGACYISRLERQGWGRRCCASNRAAYRAVSLPL